MTPGHFVWKRLISVYPFSYGLLARRRNTWSFLETSGKGDCDFSLELRHLSFIRCVAGDKFQSNGFRHLPNGWLTLVLWAWCFQEDRAAKPILPQSPPLLTLRFSISSVLPYVSTTMVFIKRDPGTRVWTSMNKEVRALCQHRDSVCSNGKCF